MFIVVVVVRRPEFILSFYELLVLATRYRTDKLVVRRKVAL